VRKVARTAAGIEAGDEIAVTLTLLLEGRAVVEGISAHRW